MRGERWAESDDDRMLGEGCSARVGSPRARWGMWVGGRIRGRGGVFVGRRGGAIWIWRLFGRIEGCGMGGHGLVRGWREGGKEGGGGIQAWTDG